MEPGQGLGAACLGVQSDTAFQASFVPAASSVTLSVIASLGLSFPPTMGRPLTDTQYGDVCTPLGERWLVPGDLPCP